MANLLLTALLQRAIDIGLWFAALTLLQIGPSFSARCWAAWVITTALQKWELTSNV